PPGQRAGDHAPPGARRRSGPRPHGRPARVRMAPVLRPGHRLRVSTTTDRVQPPAEPTHRALALTDDEYEAIVALLGREPNVPELAMFAAMWSEHCSYKSSKAHLRTLPT